MAVTETELQTGIEAVTGTGRREVIGGGGGGGCQSHVRLCTTYGVTEACVYQTLGELFSHCKEEEVEEEEGGGGEALGGGSYVGTALASTNIRICEEGPPSLPAHASDARGGALPRVHLREVEESSCCCSAPSRCSGEIVLEGRQIDALSGYYMYNYQLPEQGAPGTATSTSTAATAATAAASSPYTPSLPPSPFVLNTWTDGSTSICYRTGDRGFLSPAHTDPDTHTGPGVQRDLYLLGRIVAAPRMIKVNGIRVDPLEIEACLLEEYSDQRAWKRLGLDSLVPLIRDCAVIISSEPSSGSVSTEDTGMRSQRIIAYCVLSDEAAGELRILHSSPHSPDLDSGVLCPPGPLLTLLHMRCTRQLKHGVAPAVFVFIRQVPLTSTGKRDLRSLPAVAKCRAAGTQQDGGGGSGSGSGGGGREQRVEGGSGCLLMDCGGAGPAVAAEIISCLNLQPCQHSSVTTQVP